MKFNGYVDVSFGFIREALSLLEPKVEKGENSIILELPKDSKGFAPLLKIELIPRSSDIEKCD